MTMPSERAVERASGIVRRYVNPSNPAIAHITEREHKLIEIVALALDTERAEVWEGAAAILQRGSEMPVDTADRNILIAEEGVKIALRELAIEFRARAVELRGEAKG